MEEDKTVAEQSGRSGSLSDDRLGDTLKRVAEWPVAAASRSRKLPEELYDRYDTGMEIHLLRWATGLTLEEFGDKVGYSHQNIYRLEHGQRLPSLARLMKLADALGLKVKITFERADENDSYTIPQEFLMRVRGES